MWEGHCRLKKQKSRRLRGRGEVRQVTRSPFKKDFECLENKVGFGSAVNLDNHGGE